MKTEELSAEESSSEEMPLTGAITPPMANGDVVFEEPWQSRVFGMARVLCEQGRFEWDEFREHLIRQISDWEDSQQGDSHQAESYFYFDHFLKALTTLVDEKNICSADELDEQAREFEARPHGFDHQH